MSSLPTPESLRASVPDDADRSYIVADLRPLAVPISSLLPDPRNARKHPEKNLDAVKASLRSFGQRKPVVVNSRTLIVEAGNGTLEAAKAIGWQYVAAVFQDDDAVTATGYGLADNRSAELAEWDTDVLTDLIKDLKTDGVDVSDLGWSGDDLLAMLPDEGDGEGGEGDDDPAPIDKAAELQNVWQTARGQVWEIPSKSVPGRCHRVMCGDSTEEADVGALLDGIQPVMMETDPPYGIDYSALKNGIPRPGFAHHTEQHGDIENDGLTDGAALQAFLEKMIRAALPYMSGTAAYYFWHPMLTQGTFFAAAAAAAADILIHRQIIWVKPGFVLTRSGMYHWKHELCFYGWVRGSKPPWYGDKSQTSVWDDFGRDDDHGMHPTQKPIELFLRPMRNHVQRGEWVYEPFGGSGSQVLAAERHGCLCAAMELSPKFAAVILERAKNAGLEPRLFE